MLFRLGRLTGVSPLLLKVEQVPLLRLLVNVVHFLAKIVVITEPVDDYIDSVLSLFDELFVLLLGHFLIHVFCLVQDLL